MPPPLPLSVDKAATDDTQMLYTMSLRRVGMSSNYAGQQCCIGMSCCNADSPMREFSGV
ncbi:hypothetical protein OKW50_007968 [Paraburkholderia youngii]